MTFNTMIANIDRNRPKKLYLQVGEAIREEIEEGRWPVGSRIPVEDELCKKYDVSKATIRFAVLELVRKGYLNRQQGRGTFVCRTIPAPEMRMTTEFDELMLEPLEPVSVRVLAQTLMTPVDDLDVKLEAPGETHVIYIRRLALAANEPILLAESYIPYHFCPELLREEIGSQFLTEVFEKKIKIPITRIKVFIDLTHATDSEGLLLGVPKKTELLLIDQHFYSAESQVMYMRTVKRVGRFRFSREFTNK